MQLFGRWIEQEESGRAKSGQQDNCAQQPPDRVQQVRLPRNRQSQVDQRADFAVAVFQDSNRRADAVQKLRYQIGQTTDGRERAIQIRIARQLEPE